MKIVFISGLYPPHTKGGGEISTYLIAEGLKKRGHQVEVITGRDVPELLKKPLFERRMSRKVARRLTELDPGGVKPDTPGVIWHAHDFRSALALSEMGSACQNGGSSPSLVVTARDYAPVCGTTNNVLADGSRCHCTLGDIVQTTRFREAGFPRNMARAWQYWHNTPYRKRAFRKIANHVYISHAQRSEIAEQLDLSGIRSEVIYNPISDEYLQPLLHTRCVKGGRVLYVGRFEDYKGSGLLTRAWKEVRRKFPDAELKLVGAKTPGGPVPYEKLIEVFDDACIVVSPHIWTEPFGRTVAEAVARGKVVVAANSGGPGEIIRDGETGLLFEKNNAAALAERIEFALNLRLAERSEIGAGARVWVRENLAADVIAGQYENFYREISDQT